MVDGGSVESKWTIDTGEIRSARGEFDKIVRQGDDGSRSWGGFFAKFSQIGNIITGIDSAINIVSRLVGVVSSLGAQFGAVIEDGIQFEDTFAKAMAQLNPEQVTEFSGSLRELALQMGKETAFSAQEAANGIEELLKAGLTASEIMGGALKTSLDAAAAGEMSVGEAAATVAINMKVFGLAAEDTTRIADLLAGAANLTTADVSEMSQALNQSGVVMKTLKIPIEDSVTLLSLLAENGLKGSDAGTSLKTALLRLVPATDDAKEAYKTLGIEVFNANGKLKPMREIVGELETGFKGLTDAEKIEYQTMIFGQDAIRASSILVEGGVAAWDKLKGSISEFSAADVASAKLNSLAGDLEQLHGSQETLNISITQAFVPGLRAAAQWATEIVNKMIEWVQVNNAWLQVQITGAIQGLINWLTSLWTNLNSTVESMGGWGTVTEQVKTIIVDAWNALSTAFNTAWGVLQPIFFGLAGFFAEDGQVSTWGGVIKTMWDIVSPLIGLFVTGWQAIGSTLGYLSVQIPEIWDTIIGYFGSLKTKVENIFGAIVNAFRSPLETIQALFDGMTEKFRLLFGESIWPDWFNKLSTEAGHSFGEFEKTIGENLAKTAGHLDGFSRNLGTFVFDADQTMKKWAEGTVRQFAQVGNFIVESFNPYMTELNESYLQFLKQVEGQFGESAIPDGLANYTYTPAPSTAPPVTVPIPPTTVPTTYTNDTITGGGVGGGIYNFTIQTMDNVAAIEAVVRNVLREVTDGQSVARARG